MAAVTSASCSKRWYASLLFVSVRPYKGAKNALPFPRLLFDPVVPRLIQGFLTQIWIRCELRVEGAVKGTSSSQSLHKIRLNDTEYIPKLTVHKGCK
jgi:hypothetical protein